MADLKWIEQRITLRWNDIDLLGHVNHAVYLSYLGESRDRLGVAGLGPQAMQELVIVRLEIDYLAEARLADEWVVARSRLLKIGTSSLRTADEVVRPDGVVVARAETVTVLTDRVALKSRPLTAEERAALEQLL